MREICALAPVIPVLVIDDIDDAVPLAEALVAGGLPVLEVTLRTPCALAAIERMCRVPGAIVGAGTLLAPQDMEAAGDAGAAFGVSPGTTPRLIEAAGRSPLPMLPGAATASEVMALLEHGFDMLKFFPAESAGGIGALRGLGGPLSQVTFCPTGGIGPDNARGYLALDNVACVGGSWVTPGDLVARRDWPAMAAMASMAFKETKGH